jgi:hypothetical protein
VKEPWSSVKAKVAIEAIFATVWLQTAKARGCFPARTEQMIPFKLCESAQKRWLRLHDYEKIGLIIRGIKYDGLIEKRIAA